jgi:hypothetical protein
MRYPREWYQMLATIEHHFPDLRASQQRGLALWVYGTFLAKSACQSSVIAALATLATFYTLRQHLREWLFDGPDKATPCHPQLDVTLCFAPLLRWLLQLWQRPELALAIDATAHGEQTVALVISVLYRGSAIPLAWQVLPANRPGPWIPHILRLLQLIAPQLPPTMQVLVLTDRGLWSPRLWKQIRALGLHPLMRVKNNTSFQPHGGCRLPVHQLLPGPGYAWVGQGTAFKAKKLRQRGTLIVLWHQEQKAPWVVLTDLPPGEVGVCWYGLRVWIELGFRALEGVGCHCQPTRRSDAARVGRHWLVLAVATLYAFAYDTRVEDAEDLGVPPQRLRSPRPVPDRPRERRVSLLGKGVSCLVQQLCRGRLWRRLWLMPELWPSPPPELRIIYHQVAYHA